MNYGFFKNLYGDADGFLAIWESTTKKTRWLDREQRQKFELNDVQELLDAKKNVYFGLGLQAQPCGENSRGNAAGVIALPGGLIWTLGKTGTPPRIIRLQLLMGWRY